MDEQNKAARIRVEAVLRKRFLSGGGSPQEWTEDGPDLVRRYIGDVAAGRVAPIDEPGPGRVAFEAARAARRLQSVS